MRCWYLTFLTHLYLFVMVGGIWAAGIVQRVVDRRAFGGFLICEAIGAIGLIVALGLLTGILSWQDRSGGTMGFGIFSMNLGSPFVPQLSGVIPPLRHYRIGTPSQVLTYLGLGALLVLACATPGLVLWLRKDARRHVALLVVMAGFTLFALSNIVTLGSHVLLHIPLSPRLAYAFGAFRASGRFFWPVADALIAFSVLTVLRRFHATAALLILAMATTLQGIDVGPVRQAVAASTRYPVPAVLDRAAVNRALVGARAVMVFPSYGCVGSGPNGGGPDLRDIERLQQANVELQLLAAWRNLPINSVVNSRVVTDCTAEAATQQASRRPGVAYFYLTANTSAPTGTCQPIGWLRMCKIASSPKR